MRRHKAGKVFNHTSYLFSACWCFTFLSSLVGIINYSELFNNALSMSLLIVITVWLGLLSYKQTKERSSFEKFLLFLGKPLLILSTISLVVFSVIKYFQINNLLPVYLNRLVWPFFLCLYLVFRSYFYKFYLFIGFTKKKKRVVYLLIFSFIVFLFVNNVTILSRNKINGIIFMLKHPFAGNDNKLKVSVGDPFYTYVLFIKENTPPDSNILIPPQGYPWPQTGNKGYLQYFLYPRHLFNGGEKEAGIDLAKEKIDYILLAWGESNESEYGFTNGWPKFDVKAKEIIYLTEEKKMFVGDYHYDPDVQNQWGIIKIK